MGSKAAEHRRKIRRRVMDRNRRFRSLGLKEQRIKIIKDVIASLTSNKYSATQGLYVKLPSSKLAKFSRYEQLNIALEDVSESCRVCGIGGIFLSAVTLNNKYTVGDYDSHDGGSSKLRDYLNPWFSDDQLDLIETAFERDSTMSKHSGNDVDLARDFGRKYLASKLRLLAICNNILENKGEFVPPNLSKI